ncbi:permease for cytosine/purines uracil thiamine allantoin [Salinisphaera sp. S4-8]|uniref:cytosine permease n=1 Tax=Salinisphaera sp. S4-8 TaxID=633357 RepID=UPI00333EE12E
MAHTEHDFQDFEFSAVPAGARRGFWTMLAVMLGFTFFSASMWAGGTLGKGLTLFEFASVVLAGNLVLGLYAVLLAFIASRTGLSTHLLSRYAFGVRGSWLPSFLLGGTQVGWFGVGVVMFALPIEAATGINIYLLIAIGGVLMTATAWVGFKALTILSFIAVPAIFVLGNMSVAMAVGKAGGINALAAITPDDPITLAVALTACIGSFISGATLTPDFVRFARSPTIGVSTTLIAFFLGNSLMFTFGAVGALVYSEADISQVMFAQGLILPAILVLGLNIWTTNDNALYAASLGFANITRLPKHWIVIVNGTIGTLAALWLYNNFVGWLSFLSSALPPIGAILIADFFIIARRHYPALAAADLKPVNWIAVGSWAVGFAAANLLPGIPPVNAVLSAFVAYLAASYGFGQLAGRRAATAE